MRDFVDVRVMRMLKSESEIHGATQLRHIKSYTTTSEKLKQSETLRTSDFGNKDLVVGFLASGFLPRTWGRKRRRREASKGVFVLLSDEPQMGLLSRMPLFGKESERKRTMNAVTPHSCEVRYFYQ